MSLRERTTKNIRRNAALNADAAIVDYANELVSLGMRGAYIMEISGFSKQTVDLMIDRDRGVRKAGRAAGSVELFQDDTNLRLITSVFLHAYFTARETDSYTDPGGVVRAFRALEARSPNHGVKTDVLYYALKQVKEGVFSLPRCTTCGSHFLRIKLEPDAKRTVEGDCFVCSYRFKPIGRSTSIAGRDLLTMAKNTG